MGTQIPDLHGQAKVLFSLTGDVEEMITTFGFGNQTSKSALDCAFDIYDEWLAAWPAADLAPDYTFVGVEVAVRFGTQLVTAERRDLVAGTAAFAPLPQNCSLLIKKNTVQGGREHRGRSYLPAGFLNEASVSSIGIIGSGTVTAFQANADALLAGLTAQDLPMMLLHSDPLNTPDTVSSWTVDNLIATQRSRMRGR